MPAHAHLLRQFHVVQRLQAARGWPVPFEELRRYLLEQTSVGDFGGDYQQRTFQREIPLIAENFGIGIRSRRGQGYHLTETDPLTEGHQRLLEAFELREFLRLPTALGSFVQAEARRPLGLEYLRPLLRAAQTQQVVELSYQKHWEDSPQQRTAGPLLLREFRGRWYVVALMISSGRLACFGLDRILSMTTASTKFVTPVSFDSATYFAHCFGITRPANGELAQEVLLRFEVVQGRYALSYPLHTSQQTVLVSDDEIRISLHVYNTHELRMELLSYGPEVEVLAPADLRAWLRAAHKEAAE